MRERVTFAGIVVSIQPRIRLLRSFDQRSHTYLGYVIRVRGRAAEQDVLVAIGWRTQDKQRLRAGDRVAGNAVRVDEPTAEIARLYRVSGLRIVERSLDDAPPPPPWLNTPPPLAVYRERGHRRLDGRTYDAMCATCIWGCRMPTELIIDHWKPDVRQHREETFCYGPLSCPIYRAGAQRRVPGRRGMVWIEDDWVDEEEVAHRSPDA